jgi:hypothetical protein
MRICPTCGGPVDGAPRWCPRCAAPLPGPYPPGYPYPPEPGYSSPPGPGWPADPGYPAGPGYPAAAGYPGQSRYVPEAEYRAEPGYPGGPGYPDAGYPGDAGYPDDPRYLGDAGYPGYAGNSGGPGYLAAPGYLPAPGLPAEPGYAPEAGDSVEPNDYPGARYGPSAIVPRGWPEDAAEPDPAGPYPVPPGRSQPGLPPPVPGQPAPSYQPWVYQGDLDEPGDYEAEQDEPDRSGRGRPEPGPYLPGRSAPPWEQPDSFGDLFAGGPVTRAFSARPVPGPGGPEEHTDARLLRSPPRRARRSPRYRAQVATAAFGAVALLSGAVLAWNTFGPHQTGPGTRLAGRQTTAAHRAAPAPRGRATPSPPVPAPPVPAPGGAGTVVTMAPGVSQVPDAARVDGFLVSYFTAINAHDYQQYEQLLIPARRAQLSAAAFARGYGTTTDTAASIVGISPTGPGVAVTVTFTSQQRAAPGADVTACTTWDITLYLQNSGGTLLIGNPPHRYHAYRRSCP